MLFEDANYEDQPEMIDGIPVIRITKEEHMRLCKPWRKGLIIKLLGKNLPRKMFEYQVRKLWRLKEPIKMANLGNHFYVVRMFNDEDYEKFIFGGPWLLSNHYLTVQKWYPDFDCDNASISKIPIWVCVPKLAMEFFDKDILARIGNSVGRTLRVDETTYNAERGQFARISVEVDLSKPLQFRFYFRGKL